MTPEIFISTLPRVLDGEGWGDEVNKPLPGRQRGAMQPVAGVQTQKRPRIAPGPFSSAEAENL
jgi:hypothetical protein